MLEKILRWTDKYLLIFLVLVFALRCGFLVTHTIGLIGDESYYWDWSRHPDWCYFSKPPMIAWLIGASTWLFGDSTAAVRFPAVALGSVFLWYFHATATAFYGRRVASFVLLLILATPNNVLANLMMTIDPPLYCFWMMSVYYMQQALFKQQPRAWLWAGSAAALGLLSKQVAIALPLLLLVFILLNKPYHIYLKRQFWVFLAPMLLATVPIVLWNQQHAWVMFNHSSEHFTTQGADTLTKSFKNFKDMLFYQILLISPILFAATVYDSLQRLVTFKTQTPQQQFLWLMGPVLVLGVLLLSIIQKVQGNWPMPFYFTALILLGDFWQRGHWRRTFNIALCIGYVLVIITYLLPTVLQLAHLQNTRLDPVKRFNHWPELVAHIQTIRQQAISVPADSFVVALGHRNMASQLAFYLPDHPQVYRYETSGTIQTQYELWNGPGAFAGGNALIVSDSVNIPAEIKSAFLLFTPIGRVENPMHADLPFYLFKAEHLQAWPVSGQ